MMPPSAWFPGKLLSEDVAGCLFFHMECLSPLFQGRAGSDGARGMPGQTGPKVSCPPYLLVSGNGIHHHP